MAEDETGAAPKAETSIRAKTPSDFLESIKGKPVLVKLNSGVDYRGACVPLCTPPPFRPPVGLSFSFTRTAHGFAVCQSAEAEYPHTMHAWRKAGIRC